MERLIINTGLDGFIMPDKITSVTETAIEAIKMPDGSNGKTFINIETMAQVCALHTRVCVNFEKHAFLLKINTFQNCTDVTDDGEILINAQIISASKEAFSYTVHAYQNGNDLFNGKLLIAVTDYSDTFDKNTLKEHYRNIFKCLTKNL